jgi:hypothetical protein
MVRSPVLTNFVYFDFDKLLNKPIESLSGIFACWASMSVSVWSVLSVELSLRWNGVSGISDIASTG